MRREKVPRALAKMALSAREEKAVQWMSYTLGDKLLRGPISEVISCAKSGISPHDQREPEELG